MCFALLALGQHPDYPFILLANRDEFFARPTLPLHEWEEGNGIVGGRDLESGGSWLALNKQTDRFALVTNVRQGLQATTARRSRGLLLSDMLQGKATIPARLEAVEQTQYAGYNLVAGTPGGDVYYDSNRGGQGIQRLNAGVYGLSNAALDTPWPKVLRGKRALMALMNRRKKILLPDLFTILADQKKAQDDKLPDTGIGLEKERWLSSVFINGEAYGTRCSTLILRNNKGHILYYERTFNNQGGSEDVFLIIRDKRITYPDELSF